MGGTGGRQPTVRRAAIGPSAREVRAVRARVIACARETGLTQRELAALLGVDHPCLSRLLLGRTRASLRLGGDRWIEAVDGALARYLRAVELARGRLAAARDELRDAGLPIPASLVALEPAARRRRSSGHPLTQPPGWPRSNGARATSDATGGATDEIGGAA